MPADIGRRSTPPNADAAADLAAAFEYAILFEGSRIRVPGTRIVVRRIVVHEENVVGHPFISFVSWALEIRLGGIRLPHGLEAL
jgi:hypothetical protein